MLANEPSAPAVGASLFVNFGLGVSLPCRFRFTRVSLACRPRVSQKQQKTPIRTNAPLVQVRFAERAFRAPKASTGEVRKKRKYSRTCSRRRPARSKGDREMVPDPTGPKGQLRGAPSHIHDAPSH